MFTCSIMMKKYGQIWSESDRAHMRMMSSRIACNALYRTKREKFWFCTMPPYMAKKTMRLRQQREAVRTQAVAGTSTPTVSISNPQGHHSCHQALCIEGKWTEHVWFGKWELGFMHLAKGKEK